MEELLLRCIQALSGDGPYMTSWPARPRSSANCWAFSVACYQFDAENNGEVIVESTAVPGNEKYLGLRFPARDIPRTARDILLASPIRTTLDQRLECFRIYPSRDPDTRQYVDLTQIRSRGAAGSCRKYYSNLNVRSTCVLPLVVDNRLWGLLAFHDAHVRRVSPKLDEHLQSIAKCVSIALENSQRRERELVRKKGLQAVQALSKVDSTSNHWLRSIQSQAGDLKELIPCGGFILRLAGETLVAGDVPEMNDRHHFTDKLYELAQGQGTVYQSPFAAQPGSGQIQPPRRWRHCHSAIGQPQRYGYLASPRADTNG